MIFIYSSVDGYLGCFYFLAIINNATKNICVQIFAWTYVFIPLGYIPATPLFCHSYLGRVHKLCEKASNQ